MSEAVQKAIEHWQYIKPIAAFPANQTEYNTLASYLDELLDLCGNNHSHTAWGLINLISTIIAEYDRIHAKTIKATGLDALKYLMKEHNLKQQNMTELGSQGVVSEILNGKRTLNARQLKLLAKRFNVSIETFV